MVCWAIYAGIEPVDGRHSPLYVTGMTMRSAAFLRRQHAAAGPAIAWTHVSTWTLSALVLVALASVCLDLCRRFNG
jgi:hypothetical protein